MTEKEQKISRFNTLLRVYCSSSIKGSYHSASSLKHMCEDVIGEYVSATEYVEHFMKYENHRHPMIIKTSDYEKARAATEEGDLYSNGDLWAPIRFYLPVTQKVYSEFYQHCRSGQLSGFLRDEKNECLNG